MIFDTHAHYDDSAFDEDRDELLNSLEQAGICNVVNVASGMKSCITSIELAQNYSFIYAAVGVHPSETDGLGLEDMKMLEEYCAKPKVVAVGEIGLDYHYPDTDKKQQKSCFEWQLEIAKQINLPVIIHSRDAAEDTFNILCSKEAQDISGVIHCYSYAIDMAKKYVDMGYYIGVGGVITFKNSRKLKEVVEGIPLERIVLETDCPYLSPEPNRGKRNSSLNLPFVVDAIASIKGIDKEQVIEQTLKNAKALYRL